MLRAINGTRIKDKISLKSMLIKYGLPSVNQLAAKIKLMEVWKSLNNDGSPIRLDPYCTTPTDGAHELRPRLNRVFNYTCRLQKSESSFHVDAARIWNAAPLAIKNAKVSTLPSLKKTNSVPPYVFN